MINKNKINKFVFKGKLPVAYINSDVSNIFISEETNIKKKKFTNSRYKQADLPIPNSQVLISKIYELY